VICSKRIYKAFTGKNQLNQLKEKERGWLIVILRKMQRKMNIYGFILKEFYSLIEKLFNV